MPRYIWHLGGSVAGSMTGLWFIARFYVLALRAWTRNPRPAACLAAPRASREVPNSNHCRSSSWLVPGLGWLHSTRQASNVARWSPMVGAVAGAFTSGARARGGWACLRQSTLPGLVCGIPQLYCM